MAQNTLMLCDTQVFVKLAALYYPAAYLLFPKDTASRQILLNPPSCGSSGTLESFFRHKQAIVFNLEGFQDLLPDTSRSGHERTLLRRCKIDLFLGVLAWHMGNIYGNDNVRLLLGQTY